MPSSFNRRFTSYEFVQGAKAAGFSFTCYKEKIKWEKLASVDLDRVVRDVDISVLQEHVGSIVRCDLGELHGVDSGLVALFRLAQLCLEYCIFCQEQLALAHADLEQQHQEALKELDTTKQEIKIKKEELKKEIRRRKKVDKEKENIAQTTAFNCTQCPKLFTSLAYLESHVRRRHAATDNAALDSQLRAQLDALKLELAQEKEAGKVAALQSKEALMAREEALWARVEREQAEQRARHQAELIELTHTFQEQLKQSLAVPQPLVTESTQTSQHEEQLAELQAQLENKRDADVRTAVEAAESAWRVTLEKLEARHQAELRDLQEQILLLQAQALDARQTELKIVAASPTSNASPFVPKPAVRRRRAEHQRPSGKLDSSLPPQRITFDTKSPTQVVDSPLPWPRGNLEASPAPEEPSSERPRRPTSLDLSGIASLSSPPASRAKSARASLCRAASPQSDTEEETSGDVSPQTMQEMKETLKENPEILDRLREDVERVVDTKLTQLGLEQGTSGLPHKQMSNISKLLSQQRKLAKKHFSNYAFARDEAERRVEELLAQQLGTAREEPNNKPSKIKKSMHLGFFSKITQHYNRKKKKSAEILTSTPLQKSQSVPLPSPPASILKLSKKARLWSSRESGANSEPASPTSKTPPLERALSSQSLPVPKTVTFAPVERSSSSGSSSWDEEAEEPAAVCRETPSASVQAVATNKDAETKTKDEQFLIKTTTPVPLQPKPSTTNGEHIIGPSFLAPSFTSNLLQQKLNLSVAGTAGSLGASAAGQPSATKKSTLADRNDNSWDLEDI